MGLNVLNACVEFKVKKIVNILTSCAYRSTLEILKEDTFLDGIPDDQVAAHGLAKRNLFIYSKFLNKQYGLNSVRYHI